ncbi:MAG TPA: hemolysin family protein [Methylomusa anaerophila]|uniref:hemolysin family protein n=1 Tax=Methylomusa anaerophila TaxID=1930071 RepID=UPI002C5F5CE3|nr:hemolysin family protein [Methylomusa anaerophila]HML90518.1 hemolysin family protein [Methylomusa anaerophila]
MEIAIIFVLIIANGIFAMTEIAIVSSRKARLERKAAEGGAGAKAALELANDPTQLLSTVQVGISVIGVVTGAYGGATIAQELAVYLKPLPFIGAHSNAVSMVGVIALITYVSLIIGELVPKKIALNNPEPIAAIVAIPMRFFAKVFLPLVRLLSVSTNFVLKALRVKEPMEPGVTEEEIKIMIAEGTAVGTFEETEKDMVDRVFRLADMRVSALMTPKTQIDWIDLEDDDEYNWGIITESNHSRLPVARESLDDIVGFVYARDVLSSRGNTLLIEDNTQEPLFIPRSLRVFKLLEQFQQTGTHIAFVMDEFGGMIGLVTLHDILEQLIGELPQEVEDTPEIVQRDENSWLLDGLLSIDEFRVLFDIGEMPGQDKEHYQTLGGFITSCLGSMPKTGDTFEWAGLKFEIVDMDGMRIDKAIVTKLE